MEGVMLGGKEGYSGKLAVLRFAPLGDPMDFRVNPTAFTGCFPGVA